MPPRKRKREPTSLSVAELLEQSLRDEALAASTEQEAAEIEARSARRRKQLYRSEPTRTTSATLSSSQSSLDQDYYLIPEETLPISSDTSILFSSPTPTTSDGGATATESNFDDLLDLVEPSSSTTTASADLQALSMSLLTSSSRKAVSNVKRISNKERNALLSSIQSKPLNQQSLLDVIFTSIIPQKKKPEESSVMPETKSARALRTKSEKEQRDLRRQLQVNSLESRSEYVICLPCSLAYLFV